MIWHIIPVDDTMIHEESMDCDCRPSMEVMEDNEVFITHNAQDGRSEENNELVWHANKRFSTKKKSKKENLVEITTKN